MKEQILDLIPNYDELVKEAKSFGSDYIFFHAPDDLVSRKLTSRLMKQSWRFQHVTVEGQHRFKIYFQGDRP